FYLPVLDIENGIGRIALAEDHLILAIFGNAPAFPFLPKKCLHIECYFLSSHNNSPSTGAVARAPLCRMRSGVGAAAIPARGSNPATSQLFSDEAFGQLGVCRRPEYNPSPRRGGLELVQCTLPDRERMHAR